MGYSLPLFIRRDGKSKGQRMLVTLHIQQGKDQVLFNCLAISRFFVVTRQNKPRVPMQGDHQLPGTRLRA
ncbi:hypothetical protein D3C72_2391030 [compost metagenome]